MGTLEEEKTTEGQETPKTEELGQPEPTALNEASPEEFRTRRESGEGVEPESPEALEPEAAEENQADEFIETDGQTDESIAAQGNEGEAVAPKEVQGTDDSKGTPRGVQRRIDTLTRQKRELEERLAASQPQPVRPGLIPEPNPEDYTDVEVYDKDVDEWKYQQRRMEEARAINEVAAKAEGERAVEAWNVLCDNATDKYADFDAVMENANANNHPLMGRPISDAMNHSPIGGEIMYHLAKNPEVVAKINAMHPIDQFSEIRQLESNLKAGTVLPSVPAEKQPTKRQSKPLSPVTSSGATQKGALNESGPAEYRRRREAGEGSST